MPPALDGLPIRLMGGGEFGVRLALGAAPRDVLRLVMRQGLGLALLGLLIGLGGALWLTRFLGSLLFEVSPIDPLVQLQAWDH